METLAEILSILTLGLLFWARTGKLERQVSRIADALVTADGTISGDAVLERFDALDQRMGAMKAELGDALTNSDQAKRGMQKLSARQLREEEQLIGKVTETILPQIVHQMEALRGAPTNGAPVQQPFLVR